MSKKNLQQKECIDFALVTQTQEKILTIPSTWIKALFTKFSVFWGHKWNSILINDDYFNIAVQEWREALNGIKGEAIKEAIDYCRDNLDWPPSVAEFRRICLQSQGLPSTNEIMQLAIRRDFNNPIVEQVYLKIGSWAFSHDTEEELSKKIEMEVKNLYSVNNINKLFHMERS